MSSDGREPALLPSGELSFASQISAMGQSAIRTFRSARSISSYSGKSLTAWVGTQLEAVDVHTAPHLGDLHDDAPPVLGENVIADLGGTSALAVTRFAIECHGMDDANGVDHCGPTPMRSAGVSRMPQISLTHPGALCTSGGLLSGP
jgi:hypothetical protein